MKDVKVLGPGCKRCDAVESMVREAAARLGVEVTVEKVADYAEIARFGAAATPGVVVDGALVHAGGLPKAETVESWLVE